MHSRILESYGCSEKFSSLWTPLISEQLSHVTAEVKAVTASAGFAKAPRVPRGDNVLLMHRTRCPSCPPSTSPGRGSYVQGYVQALVHHAGALLVCPVLGGGCWDPGQTLQPAALSPGFLRRCRVCKECHLVFLKGQRARSLSLWG